VFSQADLVASINKALVAGGVEEASLSQYSLLVDFMARGTHFLVLGDNRSRDEW
jgi:hypothetical protein